MQIDVFKWYFSWLTKLAHYQTTQSLRSLSSTGILTDKLISIVKEEVSWFYMPSTKTYKNMEL